MNVRRAGVALFGGLASYGAYYSYTGSSDGLSKGPGMQQARSYLNNPTSGPSLEHERKAIIVGADNLYTGIIPGDGPLIKDTDGMGRKVLEMITPSQATQMLRKSEESYLVGRGTGVVRYDIVQLPSNDPIEDDHAEKIIDVGSSATGPAVDAEDWMFWGVFDGHSGWTTSARLRQALISFVARENNDTYKSASRKSAVDQPSPEAIDTAIKLGFTKLDDEIVHGSVDKVLKAGTKLVAAEALAPALSGSCALLSFYDSRSKLLRVACTGDSRAVLGRKGDTGKWTATALSVDQTGSNPDEEARLRAAHPGEPDVIRAGRVLGGLEPTRAFGDASFKWTYDIAMKLKFSFFGKTPSKQLRTPPYVTAEPVISTTKISPEKGDFLVMATDGLWEMLTNEEVVGLVGQWIESQEAATSPGSGPGSWVKMLSWQQKGLPVEHGPRGSAQGGKYGGSETPVRQLQYGIKDGLDERFVVQDENVATHLVRNALGGKDQDMICALLTLPAPYSRRYRDDLTVEVIFFGEGAKGGDVVLNKDASAGAANFRAKL